MSVTLRLGDCREVMAGLPPASVDAVVCDPPYELGFMGKAWDSSGVAFDVTTWREVLRVLKPGGYLLAFSGTRTYHRMTCAIEDAGFEIRDCISWQYGSGFPKSHDVSKAIDKAAGAEREVVGVGGRSGKQRLAMAGHFAGEWDATDPATDAARQWQGWGTALKPAWEPIVVARKPLEGTVAANVLKHGTGALNIDGCRVTTMDALVRPSIERHDNAVLGKGLGVGVQSEPGGRWPANLLLSCPPDCDGDTHAAGCPCAALDAQSGVSKSSGGGGVKVMGKYGIYGGFGADEFPAQIGKGDSGGASRFFNRLPIEADDLVPFIYAAKASRSEREAGCDALPTRSGADAVGREEDTAGTQSPSAGAGRTASSVRNHHPTVKPIAVMRHLVRLVTPPGGVVLDPFMGSGSTGVAAVREGFRFIGVDMSEDYLAIARARIDHATGPLFKETP